MPDLQKFLPFLKFFNELPSICQMGYVILFFIFFVYTLFCMNLKYTFNFNIRNAQDNNILKDKITIVLQHLGNFSVIEKFNGSENEAEIASLKSLNSSSLNIVLALDISKSMNKYIPQVRNAVKAFLKKIQYITSVNQSKGKIAVLNILGESKRDTNFIQSHGKTIWFDFNKFDNSDLAQIITQINPTEQNTPLYEGLIKASEQLSELDANAYNIIVCLTDGEVNRGTKDVNKLIKTLQEKQTPVFSIGYGQTPKSSLHIRNLEVISKESGGGDRNIGSLVNADINQLDSLFTKIANSIGKADELSWRSTAARRGEKVEVTIKIDYQAANQKQFTTEIQKYYTLKDIKDTRVP